jgi:lysophospholipase L1-like esterase
MNYLIKHSKKLLSLVLVLALITSCKDYQDLDVEPVDTGDADFSSYVAVGNSLTAGFQSNALYEDAQEYSFPNLLARQLQIENFEQPLVDNPGIGDPGRIELTSLENSTTQYNTGEPGMPINTNLDRPYNNLGIPGAILADFLGQDLPGNSYDERRQGTMYNLVLRNQGNTQAEQLSALEPEFVSFWLGNNDILGYVTSGGDTPYVPPSNFTQLYEASIGTVAQTGADAVLYNIPDVTSIPYVFLVNSRLVQSETIIPNTETGVYELPTPQGQVPIWVEVTDPNQPGVVQDTVQMRTPLPESAPGGPRPGAFFLLHAQEQLSELFGNGVGTTPSNPIEHELVLDNGETTQAKNIVTAYNGTVEAQASNYGFAYVDVNTTFNQIFQNFQQSGGTEGITQDGVTLTPTPGSLFSLDGVHPSNRGHAIITNLTIDALNSNYNSDIDKINIAKIPEGIPVAN